MKKIIIILLIFTSCGVKKKTTEIVKNDTIIVTKDRIITKAVIDSIFIKEPCDSLGILRPFKQRLVVPQGNITIESKNNTIEARINLDSVVQSIETVRKSSIEKSNHEVIKYRIPIWIIISLGVSILLNLLLIRFR